MDSCISDTIFSITSEDALGRKLRDVSGFREGKYVGVFYFLWHGQHPSDKVRNVTDLLRDSYDDLFDASLDSSAVPYDSWLHFQEPLFGYYSSDDTWVMRKHIELFIYAGVDFVVFDYTNGVTYDTPLRNFMELLLEYKAAGWNVPKISFYINVNPLKVTEKVYKEVYLDERYKELVFRGNSNKPIIISVPHELNEELNSFFDVRASQWYREQYGERTWPYWDCDRVWRKYTDMVSVSLAQSPTSFSFSFESYDGILKDNYGRGFSGACPENGHVDNILSGANFQEGWDEAVKLDPDYIFVTGWNEWVMQKMNLHAFFPDIFKEDYPCYTDNFNVEFSRDAEMTRIPTYYTDESGIKREGYGDNFFLQLVNNIRAFKGIPDGHRKNPSRYISVSEKSAARDSRGFYPGTHYEEPAPEDKIREVTVSNDADNIYFTIISDAPVCRESKISDNKLLVYVGSPDTSLPTWEGYSLLINRRLISDSETVIECLTPSGVSDAAGSVPFRIIGNMTELTVPRRYLGGAERIIFKITDSIEAAGNILDYYVSGDSFPPGRLSFKYQIE